MQYMVMAMILSVTLATYLATGLKLLPDAFKLLPEVLSVIVAAYVVIVGMAQRFRYVRAAYWLVFGGIATIMLCGAIVNAIEPGPLIAGMRSYLRAIPFFLLPAVYLFKDWQIRRQLQLLLVICAAQLPLVVYQRLHLLSSGHWSGDQVFGTLMISSVLSMFLICATCVVTGMALRKRLSTPLFILLFFLLLIPTTINETKGTLVLLPIALLTTLMIGSPPAKRLQIGFFAVGLLTLFGAIYVPVYDYLSQQNNPYPYTLSEFFSDSEKLEGYLDKDSSVGTREDVGRIDAISVPLREFSHDPVKLTFGLGLGNASHSSLGPRFVGDYYVVFGNYAKATSAGAFILEIGVIGTLLVLILYVLIFADVKIVLRKDPGIMSAVAIGWAGATVLMAIATFYKSTHGFESLSYLFWYFSGLVAAQRMRLTLDADRRVEEGAIPSNGTLSRPQGEMYYDVRRRLQPPVTREPQ